MDHTTLNSASADDTDSQTAGIKQDSVATRPERLWPFLLVGVVLGIVFTRSGVISWFRIQEMFRFQSIHMYGFIGSASVVGAVGVQLIKRTEVRSFTNRPIDIPRETFTAPGWQYWLGGTAFGLGWGLLGACPGPTYVLFGNGVTVMAAAFLSSLAGVWVYGALRHRLPHS